MRANTVASFALGDYEWILAFEADELHRIVDLMRDLRASEARRHVREEIPSTPAAACSVADLVADPALTYRTAELRPRSSRFGRVGGRARRARGSG